MKLNLSLDLKDVTREIRERGKAFENTLYELNLDNNTKHLVVPRQTQIHQCKRFFNI